MPWFARDLQPLLSVAAATMNEDSTLIEANAGFLRIAKLEGLDPIGAQISQFFLQPNFTTLVRQDAGADGEIYRGLLTMGDDMAATRTLRARIWRLGSTLRLMAEYDIGELERLNEKMLELNRDYADAQLKLAQTNLKLQQREAQIVALTLTDSLTGLGNRRLFEQALATEINRARRKGGTLCALMADLDHFKQVNDTFGHEVGDRVLAAFGEQLRRQTRAPDIAARIGGEEFVVLMPDADIEAGVATAERIRTEAAGMRIEPMPEGFTVSVGVAKLAEGEDGDAFMLRTDKALYEAKHAGRNCVVVAHRRAGADTVRASTKPA
jgi:two-component system, cell cycle response regulator